MKILRFSPYFFPESVATTHLSNDVNDAFRQVGFLTENYVPTPSRGIDKQTRAKYKKIRHEVLEDGTLHIHRFPLMREGKNPVLRAFRYVLCNLKQYNLGKHAKDIDVICGSSTPPTQGYLCARVKKRLSKKYGRSVPFIYDLQDVFPDSLVNAGLAKRGSLLWRIGRKMENKIYAAADKIVVISEGFKENIMAKGVPEDKIVVIENWINTSEVVPVERENNILFDKYGLDRNKFYISYSGNIGHSQNMDILLDTAARIAKETEDVEFVIIGEGAAKTHVEERIAKEGLENVHVFPFEDYENIAHVFSLGDMGLIISKTGVGASSVPSKTWSIMSAARPVLASFDKGGDLDRVITREEAGVCIAPTDVEGFFHAILAAYRDRDLLERWGKNGRKYVEEHLTKEIGTKKWISLLKSVVETKSTEQAIEKVTVTE